MVYYPLSEVTEEAEVLRTVFHILRNVFVQQGKQGVGQVVQSWVSKVKRALQSLFKDGCDHHPHLPHTALQQTNPDEEI